MFSKFEFIKLARKERSNFTLAGIIVKVFFLSSYINIQYFYFSFKLSLSTAYITEYLVRFVARLRPNLSETDAEDLMRRLVGALTHQTVIIRNETHPAGKKFPKLRGGTEDSTLKFMIKLCHMVGGGTESISSNEVQGMFLIPR